MRKIIVAITGASGMPYALTLINELKKNKQLEVHLIVSDAAKKVLDLEASGYEDILALTDYRYSQNELGAPMASGSFQHSGMVICPCSMATLAAVAQGLGNNLIHRSADVTLKERRPLVLVPREMPLSRIHLQNMLTALDAGASIMPPCPGFYHQPRDIQDLIRHVVSRIMDALDIENQIFPRWKG